MNCPDSSRLATIAGSPVGNHAQGTEIEPLEAGVVELRQPHRWIDRHRNGTGIKNAEECDEKLYARREHQGDAIPGRDVPRNQATRDVARLGCQFTVRQRAENGPLVLQDRQVQTVGALGCMPFKNLDKGLRLGGGRHGGEGRRRRNFKSDPLPCRSGLFQCQHEITDGLGFANRLSRQPHAEGALDPHDQLGSSQTVYSKIAFDPAGREHADEPGTLGMQLAHKLPDDSDQIAFAQLLFRGR